MNPRLLIFLALIGCHEQAAAEGLFLPADAPSRTAITEVGRCQIDKATKLVPILIVVRGNRATFLEPERAVPFVLDADGQGGSARLEAGIRVEVRNGELVMRGYKNQVFITGECRAVELPTAPPVILPIISSEEIPRPVAIPADLPSCAVLVSQAKLGEVTADVAALIEQACR